MRIPNILVKFIAEFAMSFGANGLIQMAFVKFRSSLGSNIHFDSISNRLLQLTLFQFDSYFVIMLALSYNSLNSEPAFKVVDLLGLL
jgi:hypothetical protein